MYQLLEQLYPCVLNFPQSPGPSPLSVNERTCQWTSTIRPHLVKWFVIPWIIGLDQTCVFQIQTIARWLVNISINVYITTSKCYSLVELIIELMHNLLWLLRNGYRCREIYIDIYRCICTVKIVHFQLKL